MIIQTYEFQKCRLKREAKSRTNITDIILLNFIEVAHHYYTISYSPISDRLQCVIRQRHQLFVTNTTRYLQHPSTLKAII